MKICLLKEFFMKTRISLLMLVILAGALLLAACSNTATATGTTPNSPTNTGLSTEARLAIGTLKLDGTGQDLTAAQATDLLTLWQAYQSLSASDTTADAELTALVKQIEGTMTSEQTQAIDQMQITAATMSEMMRSAMPEISASSSGTSQPSTSSQSATSGGPGGGPMDGGVPPDGSGMMGDPSMAGSATQATPDAASQNTSSAQNISPMLLNVLIQMLETKSQAASQ
jgi:predicted small secreted protein